MGRVLFAVQYTESLALNGFTLVAPLYLHRLLSANLIVPKSIEFRDGWTRFFQKRDRRYDADRTVRHPATSVMAPPGLQSAGGRGSWPALGRAQHLCAIQPVSRLLILY